jgi:hypothetical protein
LAEGLVSVHHKRRIPIQRQGNIKSCAGNALVGCLGTEPFYDTIDPGTALDESLALELYKEATKVDRWPGEYPERDTGTEGLAVARIAKRYGLIAGYRHVNSLDDTLSALRLGPVMCGGTWYSTFETPDPSGRVRIGPTATALMGHAYVLDELCVESELVGCANSWGPEWGLEGRFYLSWKALRRLLSERGEVTVLIPKR